MREIHSEELKKIELDILRDVHSFCIENHIVYYLCGGTLLGAVRHGGFIPWDDDIDIYMPRQDYDRFISMYSSTLPYKILSFPSSNGYYLPFAKVCDCRTVVKETVVKDIPNCGVYIDVFPLDGLSDNLLVAKRIHKWTLQLMTLNAIALGNTPVINNFKQLVKFVVYKAMPKQKRIVKWINNISTRYAYEQSRLVGVAFGFYGERETIEKNVFGKPSMISFEGEEFLAPADVHTYLSSLYGDYMQLPPIEKRVSHHSFLAFWKE